MKTKPITDPSPVWDKISQYLVDDGGELVTYGDFLGVFDGDKMAGAFLIKRWNDYCFEIHGGVHPDYWGRGVEICRLLGLSLFYGSPCLKIVAIIPEFNRLMRRCVQKAGMHEEGIIKKSFIKWMRMHDQYIYGATKGDI